MSDDKQPIIKVVGKGVVSRRAEVAEFRIEIEESGDDPAELMQTVVTRHNQVLEVLRAELEDSEITARGTMIRRHEARWLIPEGEENAPQPKFDGGSEIWVKTERLERVGPLMSRAMSAGASSVSQARFNAKDPGAFTIEAIDTAAKAAKVRAETVAKALGLRLGQAIRLESNADGGGSGNSGDLSTFVGSARALSLGGPSDDWEIDEPAILPAELVMIQYVSATFELLEPGG